MYSDYPYEQLIKEAKNYQNACQLFLQLTTNKSMREKMQSILYNGGYQNYSLNTGLANKDNPMLEIQRRLSMGYLLLTNEEAFDYFVENNINLFHGTNISALPSIIKYGVNSSLRSINNGIDVTTGERSTRTVHERSFVSFTDVLDVARDYSTIRPEKNDDRLSFGVVIGTSKSDAIAAGTMIVRSEICEVGIKDNLPKESIKIICAPLDKLEFVKKIVDGTDIKVFAIPSIYDNFYYADEYSIGGVEIDFPRLERFRNNYVKQDLTFTLEQIKDVSEKRLISNLKKQLERFKNLFAKEEEVKYGTRQHK